MLLCCSLMTNADYNVQKIADFTNQKKPLNWSIQNDNVMGGRSVGAFELQVDHLQFEGSTNTNGGGFSSIRSEKLELDLSSFTGIELNVVGDGRQYIFSLQTDATWRGRKISYWANFNTEHATRITAKIPFDAFVPRFRGSELDGPKLDSANITEIGLYIYDGKDGPFAIQLHSITTY